MKRLAIAMTLAALPFAAAAQQSSTTERLHEVDDDQLVITEINMTVDQVDDMPVIGPEGEQIGEIEDVLADESGRIVGFAVETEGFLGLGSEDVIVRFEDLQFVGDEAVTKLTEKELEALPRWDD